MLAFDKTATGEILYEHALQSVNVFNDLLDAIVDPEKDFSETFEAIKKNYYLIAISKSNAKAVDSTSYIDEMVKKLTLKQVWDLVGVFLKIIGMRDTLTK